MSLIILKIFAVLLALIVLLVVIYSLGKRYKWHSEWQRKILHVGLGLTSLTFPWIFEYFWEVLVVCTIAVAILLIIRYAPMLRRGVGKSIYSIKRFSLGELLFATSIAFLFWVYQENLVLYIIPLAILTLSDAAAAIIGTFYGKRLFHVIQGTKSWEGTLTFSIATSLILATLLYILTDLSLLALLIIAITFAVLGALIEAFSWHGLDNFFIPTGSFLFLHTFLDQGVLQLLYQLVFLMILIAIGLITGRMSQLNTHAIISVVVFSYLFAVVGGIKWFIAPAMILLCHLILVKLHKDEGQYNFEAVISIISSGFIWLLMDQVFSMPYSFFLFVVSLAVHLQIMVLLRLEAYYEKKIAPARILLVSLVCSSLILSIYFIFHDINAQVLILCVYVLLVMFIEGVLLPIKSDRFSTERWIVEGIVCFGISASVLIPTRIMEILDSAFAVV